MSPHQRTTMKDVAEVAGVSIQTVSRVLNNSGSVSPSTREKVERAAESLRYQVNLAARSLASKRSQMVGMLVTGEIRFGVAEIFSALENRVAAEGRYLAMATASSSDPEGIGRALSYLEGLQVGGLMVVAREEATLRLVSARTTIPCVAIIAGEHVDPRVSTVSICQYDGAVRATEHLIETGCRNLVHITGDLTWQDAQERLRGFRDACRRAGAAADWIVGDSWFADVGHDAALDIIARGGVDGIVAGNDDIALGALHALHEAGVDVPGEISVVGFDDTPQAKFFVPALTSIRQPFQELGDAAFDELDARIAGRPAGHRYLQPELVVRATTRG
ncbi:LacI family DNA-binding transcriptional regulator [Corynebacterium sp. NPDC060344]|uniref:LacI family DNA-binding transcriptional regulator n=1 Tax=Corynebacterium sp. NPDC060344 TaxID=3347101 RepID=UPI003658F724